MPAAFSRVAAPWSQAAAEMHSPPATELELALDGLKKVAKSVARARRMLEDLVNRLPEPHRPQKSRQEKRDRDEGKRGRSLISHKVEPGKPMPFLGLQEVLWRPPRGPRPPRGRCGREPAKGREATWADIAANALAPTINGAFLNRF